MLRKLNIAFIILFFAANLLGHAVANIVLVSYSLFTIYIIAKNKKFNFPGYFVPFLILLIYFALTYFQTEYVNDFKKALIRKQYFFLALLIFQHPKFTLQEYKNLFKGFAYVLLLFFVISLCSKIPEFWLNMDYKVFLYHNLVSFFKNNAIYISLYISVCVLGFYILKMYKKNYLLLLFLYIFLFLLSSKNIIISNLLISALIFSPKLRKFNFAENKKLLIGFFIGIVLAIIFLAPRIMPEINSNVLKVLREENFHNYIWTGTEIRLFLAKTAYIILNTTNNWLMGVGLGSSEPYIKEVFHQYELYSDFFSYNFHDQYIQFWVDTGTIGLVLFIGFLLYYFRLSKINLFSFIYILLAISIALFTESYLERQRGIIFIVIIIALLAHNGVKTNKETTLPSSAIE